MSFLKSFIQHSLKPAVRLPGSGPSSDKGLNSLILPGDVVGPTQKNEAKKDPLPISDACLINQPGGLTIPGPGLKETVGSHELKPRPWHGKPPVKPTDTQNTADQVSGPEPVKSLSNTGVESFNVQRKLNQPSATSTNIHREIRPKRTEPVVENRGHPKKEDESVNQDLKKNSLHPQRETPITIQTDGDGTAGWVKNPDTGQEHPIIDDENDAGSQKSGGEIHLQHGQVDNRPETAMNHEPSKSVITGPEQLIQPQWTKPEPHTEDIPQVRIGQINVLIDDRAANKSGASPASPIPAPSNTFGLRGV